MMGLLNRLLLAVVVAVAALAMSVPAAFATQGVEVFDETTGTHCPQVTVSSHDPAGGCHILVTGDDIELSGHVFGIEAHRLTCDNTFEMRVEEDGTGYVTDMAVSGEPEEGAGDNCDEVVPCDSENLNQTHTPAPIDPEGNGTNHAWPFAMEEIGAEEYEGHVWVCFITDEPIGECEGELDMIAYEEHPAETPEHVLEAVTAEGHQVGHAALPEGAGTFSSHCEVTGHYDLEPEPGKEIHINHLPA